MTLAGGSSGSCSRTSGTKRSLVRTSTRSAGRSRRSRSKVCWSMVRSPKSLRNCLGRFGVLNGQKRVPLPPAMITATASASLLGLNCIPLTSDAFSVLPVPGRVQGQRLSLGGGEAAHPGQRQQEHDDGLGALVLADAVGIEPVGDGPRLLVVERGAPAVQAQEPGERGPGEAEVPHLARDAVRSLQRLDQVAGVDRLLPEERGRLAPLEPALVADQVKVLAVPAQADEKAQGGQARAPVAGVPR